MKLRHFSILFPLYSIIIIGLELSAAPSLPVTKVPVTPAQSFTGPTNMDTHAIMGQWFQSVTTSNLEYRTHEFYDNTPTNGGGTRGHLAIVGRVTNRVYDTVSSPSPPYPILSFDVMAVICNDTTSSVSGSWASGTNSHNEALSTTASYSNKMSAIILTADFALVGIPPSSIGSLPYHNTPNGEGYITATNHDFAAWYCWNAELNKDGAFYVPGWSFPSLLPGESATNILKFVIKDFFGADSSLPPTDPRYGIINESNDLGTDIFINRSTSLKISQWVNDPLPDIGVDYPTNSTLEDASNVSVFHNTVEDEEQCIAIKNLLWSPNLATNYLHSIGSSGIAFQVLQISTNLSPTNTNWINAATNEKAWPIPQVNHWTNIHPPVPTQFFRVIQP